MSANASRPRWVAWGSLATAGLAAAALGATVLVAQRALDDASRVVVRGEGDALVASVEEDLRVDTERPTAARLERELAQRGAAGLRYLALGNHDRLIEAGEPLLSSSEAPVGEPIVVGRRVRLVAHLGPPRDGPPPFFQDRGRGPPPHGDDGGGPLPRHGPAPFDGPPPPADDADDPREGIPRPQFAGPPFGGPHHQPPLLVVEFETPVFEQLRKDMLRVVVVGGAAGLALIAFALAWSRSMLRLAAAERKAERERRLVELGQMASVMAHELRNPLASLKGHAQLLAETLEDDARSHEKAERVVTEAERLERLTANLLDFVREGPIDRRAIATTDLVARALEHLDARRVDVELARAPATLWIEPDRVARALQNLIQNALQAMPEAGRVELSVIEENGDVVMEVRDYGPGLPSNEVAIFEPFVTTRAKGTGLGLAIARRVAEQHGGALRGENHAEGGAVFRLILPTATPPLRSG